MLAIPAIDLNNGHAVRLAGDGSHAQRVDIGDPRDIARRWIGHGFQRLHVVDLDAASGRGSNPGLVRDLLQDGTVPIQVGGGISTSDAVDRLFEDGARWVVVGTRALQDPDWLDGLANANPGAVIVALDVRDRRVLANNAHEWTRVLPRDVLDVIEDLARANLALGGLLITSSVRAGQLVGADLPLMEDIAEASAWPVLVAGGIATMGDLRALEGRGVAGAVIGMALYTGAIDPRAVADEFAQ
ncbi:MAG TPA: HisA/HisF-related TIM barrel protein [Gemmatimonadaceae bacterium]|nr:HisA/HisF-related TIM barrel protein [Gemmatimonadaceae bacterium]